MIATNDIIRIGTIRRAHGYQGELQCQVDNDYLQGSDIAFLVLILDNIPVPFRVLDWYTKGKDSLILSLKSIETDAQAARFVGTEVYMFRTDISEKDASQLTWQDLQGFRVVDETEGEIGVVSHVDETTINTLLTLEDGRLMPIHEDFIIDIDIQARVLRVDLPFQI